MPYQWGEETVHGMKLNFIYVEKTQAQQIFKNFH